MALSKAFDAVVPQSFQNTYQSLFRYPRPQSTNTRGMIGTIGQLRGLRGHLPWRMRGMTMLLRVLFLTVILLV